LHQRTPLFIGSRKMVEMAQDYLARKRIIIKPLW